MKRNHERLRCCFFAVASNIESSCNRDLHIIHFFFYKFYTLCIHFYKNYVHNKNLIRA